MLFNDDVLFLHVPKTGGTSVTAFLMRHLPGRIVLTEPAIAAGSLGGLPAAARVKLSLRRLRRRIGLMRRPNVRQLNGERHETLLEARDRLASLGRQLHDYKLVFAVIRNPYELEVSRYHFFRHGHHGIRGFAREQAEAIAAKGDFALFARTAAYHGHLPGRIEEWFEIGGQVPANFRVLRFENIDFELRRVLGPFCRATSLLPRLNTSEHGPYTQYLTQETEEAIYQKYRWVFDRGFYPRERLGRACASGAGLSSGSLESSRSPA